MESQADEKLQVGAGQPLWRDKLPSTFQAKVGLKP